ncbi:hypothetical protein [Shewanella sp.]|uniref:hypothetical protein n=1 Tax=Shewanella sp. TaxID=50422 RepID=UPI00262EB627|nr:hypothetical protein [Shewanella sp.]
MDWSSFLGGVIAAIVGAYGTYLLTEKIEKRKHLFESKQAINSLYIELKELRDECSQNINTIHNSYCRAKQYEAQIKNADVMLDITIPKPINITLLNSLIDKSYTLLTTEQRKGIRTIIYLSQQLEANTLELTRQLANEHTEIKPRNLLNCLSILYVIYHISSDMSECKNRYTKIDKTAEEIRESVLSALGKDMNWSSVVAFNPIVDQ